MRDLGAPQGSKAADSLSPTWLTQPLKYPLTQNSTCQAAPLRRSLSHSVTHSATPPRQDPCLTPPVHSGRGGMPHNASPPPSRMIHISVKVLRYADLRAQRFLFSSAPRGCIISATPPRQDPTLSTLPCPPYLVHPTAVLAAATAPASHGIRVPTPRVHWQRQPWQRIRARMN
jgi:hypothetical protein